MDLLLDDAREPERGVGIQHAVVEFGPHLLAGSAIASHTPNPTSVTIAGSLQSELGCSGDWQPDCAMTHLANDANDDVWQGSWDIPAGNYEYKAALNNTWDENYGLNATAGGANIPLNLASSSTRRKRGKSGRSSGSISKTLRSWTRSASFSAGAG